MATLIHRSSGLLLLLLGLIHSALTACIYGDLGADALWFAGTGLAMVLVALLNMVVRRTGTSDAGVRLICHGANLAFLLVGVWGILAVGEPQAYVGFALHVAQTLSAFALFPATLLGHRAA